MNGTILLVDDEPVVLAILRRILVELAQDYDVITVANGAMALKLLAEHPVALVMTDQRMRDMDGVTLTAAIKAVTPHCPVILMTGYATPELQQRAEAAGAEYFLAKPFPFELLEATVRAALGQERAV